MPQEIDTTTLISADSINNADTLLQDNPLLATGNDIITLFSHDTAIRYEGIRLDHTETIWQFSLLMALVTLMAILRAGYGSRMTQLTNAVLVPRNLRQILREENFLFHPFSLLMMLNTAVVYSLLIYKACSYYGINVSAGSGILFFLQILVIIGGILVVKTIFLSLMEFLTGIDDGQRENRYSWIMLHQFAGMILIPVAGIVLFGKAYWVIPGLYFALFLFIIFLVFRLGKGLYLAISHNVYFLHLFLYLCALEIMPLIVMIKVLMSQMKGFNE